MSTVYVRIFFTPVLGTNRYRVTFSVAHGMLMGFEDKLEG